MLLRTPSIQPKHSASSTDSGHVMLGLPLPFLWKPTHSSAASPWCAASQRRKAAGVAKRRGAAAFVLRVPTAASSPSAGDHPRGVRGGEAEQALATGPGEGA